MAKRLAYIAIAISISIISALLLFACSTSATYTAKYSATDGGYVCYVDGYGFTNKVSVKAFKVSDGGTVTEVTAEAKKGYTFSGWSDGVTTATRRDKGVSKNMTVQAVFERSAYSLTYNTVVAHGYIDGESRQNVAPNADAEQVTAVANKGYVFTRWSDGVTTATRQDKNVNSNIAISALFEKEEYTLQYTAGAHGSIQGETEQAVMFNDDADTVTAIPDKGYKFIGWSDGVTTAERKDIEVDESINVTAEFEPITRKYMLNDRKSFASEFAENKETLTLTYDALDGVTLPVPQRDGFTFEGWYYDGQQIADSNGQLVIDNDFVLNEEIRAQNDKRREEDRNIDIKAKWQAEETFPYKILVVYVTRIQATLYDRYGAWRNVDFTMTDLQRKFCAESTKLLKNTMDEMCDGLVDFQIDEYFTTQTITTEQFRQWDSPIHTQLFPSQIPEIQDMTDGYDSVVSVFGFSGDNPTWEDCQRFQHASGSAYAIQGSVFLDGLIYGVTIDHNTLEGTLNGNNQKAWINHIGTFTHEIAHTIETRLGYDDYHHYAVNGLPECRLHSLDGDRLYYLRMFEDEQGGPVGIPYGFWKGDIANVIYDVSYDEKHWTSMGSTDVDGRRIGYGSGNNGARREAVYGEYVVATAKPSKGYRFVQWSDGVTTPVRRDLVTGDFIVTAIFEPIVYTVNVVAGEGGSVRSSRSLEGQRVVTVEVKWREYPASAYAVADEGYRFVGWSDGTTNEYWIKSFDSSDLDIFDENNSYTLTAIFEKIE